MRHGQGLTIWAPKLTLLTKLRENRERHIRAYDDAVAGYCEEALAELDDLRDRLTEGKPVRIASKLDVPRSFEEEYDRAIGMLELSLHEDLESHEDRVELNEEQYRAYVEDQWTWTEHWRDNVGTYTQLEF